MSNQTTAPKVETTPTQETAKTEEVQFVKVYTATCAVTGRETKVSEFTKLKAAYDAAIATVRRIREIDDVPMKRGGVRGVGRCWNGTKEEKIYSVSVGELRRKIETK